MSVDNTQPTEPDNDADDSLVNDTTIDATGDGDNGMEAVVDGDTATVMDDAAVSTEPDNSWRQPYESLGF
jgi:hypothetical protein